MIIGRLSHLYYKVFRYAPEFFGVGDGENILFVLVALELVAVLGVCRQQLGVLFVCVDGGELALVGLGEVVHSGVASFEHLLAAYDVHLLELALCAYCIPHAVELGILRNELKWVQRGARARSTKQKARLQRFEELQNTQGPVKDGQVQLSSVSSRLGRTTVELEHIYKSYGEKILINDFSYIFLKNDRIGFIGHNGCGKTTLMKLLTGQTEPDSGKLEIGQTVKIGYYAQELGDEMMKPSQRVIDYIRDVAEYVDTPEGKVSAARMLERFLFAGEDQYGLLGKLSGGERRRLYLLKVLMGAPNVLILDVNCSTPLRCV